MPPKHENKDGGALSKKGKRKTPSSRGHSRSNSLNNSSPPSDSNDEDEPWSCKKCSKKFSDPQAQLLECQRCQSHFCIKCLGKTSQEYDLLANSDTMWFCISCREVVEKNIITDRKIEERCKEIMAAYELRVSKLEEAVSSKCGEAEVRQIVRDEINLYKQSNTQTLGGVASVGESGDDRPVATRANITVKELKESTDREKNLIIFGLTEPSSSDSGDRKESDSLTVKNILQFIGSEPENVSNVIRLGKRPDSTNNNSKPRPVKVNMSNVSAKKDVLKKLHKLKQAETGSIYRKISVVHDMSREERETDKKLRAEAAKRNENNQGNERFVVRGPPWDRRVVRLAAHTG